MTESCVIVFWSVIFTIFLNEKPGIRFNQCPYSRTHHVNMQKGQKQIVDRITKSLWL